MLSIIIKYHCLFQKGQHQKVEKVEQLSWDTPLKEDHVRFVCVSDTHNTKPPSIPDGDVLLHAGDFTMYGSPEDVYNFNEWLGEERCHLKPFDALWPGDIMWHNTGTEIHFICLEQYFAPTSEIWEQK